jgi:hypothetical protein
MDIKREGENIIIKMSSPELAEQVLRVLIMRTFWRLRKM